MTVLLAIPLICYAVHAVCAALQPQLICLVRSPACPPV